jgi:acylphosphatase
MIVSGRVQGVGFRFFTCRLAESFRVTGGVKNLPDGSVEIVAEGEREEVEAFLERAAKGPTSARVTQVTTYLETPLGTYRSFGVNY